LNRLPGFNDLPEGQCRHPGIEEKEPGPRLKVINRNQFLLRPVDVEQLVPYDHPVRAIWEFTGYMDLTLYYSDIKAVEGKAGSTAFDPRLLISIWIYSYSKGISSAREISRRIEYDPAYQWLTGMEPVNYHTLSDFRSTNREMLNDLFTNTLGLLSAEGLITLERVMHDGTKIRACAGSDGFRREERIREHLEAAREQVRLMEETPDEDITLRKQRARERAAREKKEKLELALIELEKIREKKTGPEKKKDARVSTTDPEARIMKESNGGFHPAYNIQISTDAASGIIVAAGVSQHADDYNELIPAAKRIEENTRTCPGSIVADGGFTSRANIIAMDEECIDFIGSLQDRAHREQLKKRKVDPAFYPDRFSYNPDTDIYTCPQKKNLTYAGKESLTGKTNFIYKACKEDCQSCTYMERCCPGVTKRSIIRGVEDPAIIAFQEKMKTEEAKALYKKRGPIAEFPNAWIKTKLGLMQFHLRGIVKIGMETIWACLTYNIQQWIRLAWRPARV
jgi:transposase